MMMFEVLVRKIHSGWTLMTALCFSELLSAKNCATWWHTEIENDVVIRNDDILNRNRFSISCKHYSVLIEWQMFSEKNLVYFILQFRKTII